MDSSIYIFGVFATPALTFFVFWILENLKSGKEKRDRNIRLLRAILIELKGNNHLYSKDDLFRGSWISLSPMILISKIWENHCGEINLPENDQTSLESVYKTILSYNARAECFHRAMPEGTKAPMSLIDKMDPIIVKYLELFDSFFPKELEASINAVENYLRVLQKETLIITVLKEFLEPSHLLVRIFENFPKKKAQKRINPLQNTFLKLHSEASFAIFASLR